MIDINKDGLTQSTISLLSNSSVAKVCRYIIQNKISPLSTSLHTYQRFSIPNSRKIIQTLGKYKNYKTTKNKFAFYNFKGGTGKTSICYQVSTHFALMGFNVLMIDADPQGHLSNTCGLSNNYSHATLYDLLIKNLSFDDIRKTVFTGLDCIPANLSLTRLEIELNQLPKREEKFNLELSKYIKDYDYIFVDTNPTISLLNRNVVTFCDIINVVCETQPYSLNGLKLLFEDLEKFYNNMQISCNEFNIIPNKYEDRTSSSAEAMTALREFYRKYIKEDFAVRRSEDINIAAKIGKPLALFAKKNSNASADIYELVKYLIEKYRIEI